MKDADIESNEWYWHKVLSKPVFVFGIDYDSLLSSVWLWNATDAGDTREYFTVKAEDLEGWQ